MRELGISVLVVEDEPPMRRFIRASLSSKGYRVLEADRASQAALMLGTQNPELVLLDLGLPDGDGLELMGKLRGWSQVPVIVISARDRDEDKVAALDSGADDYLTKPFSMEELLARMRVALRHSMSAASAHAPQALEFGNVRIDLVRRVVTRGAEELHLTPIEYKLLVHLALNADRVLTHRQILIAVWGAAFATQTHYVRVRMAELRKKVERNPARPKLLLTEPGVGYRLRGRA